MNNKAGKTKYSVGLAQKICERLAAGETLTAICKDKRMPAATSVRRWVLDNDDFAEMHVRARKMQAESYADKILDIKDKVEAGEMDPQAARVAIDALKWIAAKLLPAVYGDRVEHQISATSELLDAMRSLGNVGLPGDNAKVIEGKSEPEIPDKKQQH
jgi:hypothetical protein